MSQTGSTASTTDAVTLLQTACDEAYDAHQQSCSHAVWYVMKKILNANEPYRQANALITYLAGGSWHRVTLDEGFGLANQGLLVVGGLTAEPNGHVIVIYPGEKKMNGGYQYLRAGKLETLKGKAMYPLCLSTSIGRWPGAKSRGTLTVWDPWGKDDAFAQVKFWTPSILMYVNYA